ncbi:hypothetical protein [Burkholderia oklahomensis]|uniref:hypothetical protein n=1 Tax=Burkholderia oklahomensis TaxID=342113 RepID=UPI00016A97DF|nr:hypothetical protein [Burkholderia oklahomensis]
MQGGSREAARRDTARRRRASIAIRPGRRRIPALATRTTPPPRHAESRRRFVGVGRLCRPFSIPLATSEPFRAAPTRRIDGRIDIGLCLGVESETFPPLFFSGKRMMIAARQAHSHTQGDL